MFHFGFCASFSLVSVLVLVVVFISVAVLVSVVFLRSSRPCEKLSSAILLIYIATYFRALRTAKHNATPHKK